MKHCQNKSNISVVRDYLDGIRPFTTTGYRGKSYKKREVGEHWVDVKGQEWEQKVSGPVTVNRVADIVRAARDQKCACGQDIRWGSKLDRLFFYKTGMCENCLVTYETNLHILGIYDDYEKYKILSNECGFIRDAIEKLKEIIKFFSNNTGDVEMVCNSEGFTERWQNTNKSQILEDAKRDLKLGKQRLKIVTKAKNEAKKKYIKLASMYKQKIYV